MNGWTGEHGRSGTDLTWAEVIQYEVQAAVVPDVAVRQTIRCAGLPWRVRHRASRIEMLLIPLSEFVMGKSKGDDAARDDELPAHEVKLSGCFYLGRYPVTQEQYVQSGRTNPSFFGRFTVPTIEALMCEGCTRSEAERTVRAWSPPRPASDARGREWPVERVSWEDAAGFCKHFGLRLPSEAEWEFAARGGGCSSRFVRGENGCWNAHRSNGMTHPVGTLPPNPLGLHDMLGNIGEWVNDWYGGYPEAAAANPTGPLCGSQRVVRGGSWGDTSVDCRPSSRGACSPNQSGNYLGFRVARDP